MKRRKLIITMMMALQLGVISTQANPQHTNKQQTTKTQIKGHELKGKATYYGSGYKETRRTANGDRFDKNDYTAAHKTLKFGTVVRVTNKKNRKSVIVRINDRGPFGPGRVIDVTPRAGMELGMIHEGVVPCELEIISVPKKKNKT